MSEKQNQISVDPDTVISFYRQRLADTQHELALISALVDRLQRENEALHQALEEKGHEE